MKIKVQSEGGKFMKIVTVPKVKIQFEFETDDENSCGDCGGNCNREYCYVFDQPVPAFCRCPACIAATIGGSDE